MMLDTTHYTLKDLENKVLLEIFHINTLKLAFISTPVNSQSQLTTVIHGTNSIESIVNNTKAIKQGDGITSV